MRIIIENHPSYSERWTRREYHYYRLTKKYGDIYSMYGQTPFEYWAANVILQLRQDLYDTPKVLDYPQLRRGSFLTS